MANTYTPRFGAAPSDDNTFRSLTNAYSEPAYAATLALVPNAAITHYNCATLTGACTINLTVTSSKVGDIIRFNFVSDGTGRTVTFGTGFVTSAATLALTASKKGFYEAIFDGVAFVEMGRTVGI